MNNLDSEQLRKAVARFATGVAIVTTTRPNGVPSGMTVNSFTSVSLAPPLVLWSVGEHAPEFDTFRQAENTAIHLLGASQVALSNRFADADADKFAGIDWVAGDNGAPVLANCPVYLLCRAQQSVTAGDHVVLIASVQALQVRRDELPLLFYASGYREIGTPLDSGWG